VRAAQEVGNFQAQTVGEENRFRGSRAKSKKPAPNGWLAKSQPHGADSLN